MLIFNYNNSDQALSLTFWKEICEGGAKKLIGSHRCLRSQVSLVPDLDAELVLVAEVIDLLITIWGKRYISGCFFWPCVLKHTLVMLGCVTVGGDVSRFGISCDSIETLNL